MKRLFKIIFIIFFFLLGVLIVLGIREFVYVMYDKTHNPLVMYKESKFHTPPRDFLAKAFERIPQAKPGDVALILAAEIAERDLEIPHKKGYHLIAVDYQSIYYDLILPQDRVTYVRDADFDFSSVKDCELIMASFVLPFYSPKQFPGFMRDIKNCLKPGGYFIGNFLGPDTTLFQNTQKEVTYLTKNQVVDLFEGFKIIALKESREPHEKLKGVEHLIEVFAVKRE